MHGSPYSKRPRRVTEQDVGENVWTACFLIGVIVGCWAFGVWIWPGRGFEATTAGYRLPRPIPAEKEPEDLDVKIVEIYQVGDSWKTVLQDSDRHRWIVTGKLGAVGDEFAVNRGSYDYGSDNSP